MYWNQKFYCKLLCRNIFLSLIQFHSDENFGGSRFNDHREWEKYENWVKVWHDAFSLDDVKVKFQEGIMIVGVFLMCTIWITIWEGMTANQLVKRINFSFLGLLKNSERPYAVIETTSWILSILLAWFSITRHRTACLHIFINV